MRRVYLSVWFLLFQFLAAEENKHPPKNHKRLGKVLVLGSGGLVGRNLVKWLGKEGYPVLEVKNRKHIDLREPDALDIFNKEDIDFVFFLACEVGGSKFISSSLKEVQQQILLHNLRIYETVFPWLAERQVPFVFSSSYLQHHDSAYGTIKRLGEQWIKTLEHGRIARMWNIYGKEPIGLKSHVVSDWIYGCLTEGEVRCRTDGLEERQFLHVDDCAKALGLMMKHYEQLQLVTDLSLDKWTSLTSVAHSVASKAYSLLGRKCPVSFQKSRAQVRDKLDPILTTKWHKNHWKASINFEDGVQSLLEEFSEDLMAHSLKTEL